MCLLCTDAEEGKRAVCHVARIGKFGEDMGGLLTVDIWPRKFTTESTRCQASVSDFPAIDAVC